MLALYLNDSSATERDSKQQLRVSQFEEWIPEFIQIRDRESQCLDLPGVAVEDALPVPMFPFSHQIFCRVQELKSLYLEHKIEIEAEAGEDDPQFAQLDSSFCNTILEVVPLLAEPVFAANMGRYIADVVESTKFAPSLSRERLVRVFCWVLSRHDESALHDPARLHVALWHHGETIAAEMGMLAVPGCWWPRNLIDSEWQPEEEPVRFNPVEIHESSVSLVSSVCEIELQNATKRTQTDWETWQKRTYKLLSFASQVLRGIQLPQSLGSLRVVLDFMNRVCVSDQMVEYLNKVAGMGQALLTSPRTFESIHELMQQIATRAPDTATLIKGFLAAYYTRCLGIPDSPLIRQVLECATGIGPNPHPCIEPIQEVLERVKTSIITEGFDQKHLLRVLLGNDTSLPPELQLLNDCLSRVKTEQGRFDTLGCAAVCTVFEQNVCVDLIQVGSLVSSVDPGTDALSPGELVSVINQATQIMRVPTTQPLRVLSAIAALKVTLSRLAGVVVQDRSVTSVNRTVLDAINNGLQRRVEMPLIAACRVFFVKQLFVETSLRQAEEICTSVQSKMPWVSGFPFSPNTTRLGFNPMYLVPGFVAADTTIAEWFGTQDTHLPKNLDSNSPALLAVVSSRFLLSRFTQKLTAPERDNIHKLLRARLSSAVAICTGDAHPILWQADAFDYVDGRSLDGLWHHQALLYWFVTLSSNPNPSQFGTCLLQPNQLQSEYILGVPSSIEAIFHALGRVSRYQCQCGEIYVVANCGQVDQESTCPKCKRTIGGLHHNLVRGNKRIDEKLVESGQFKSSPGYKMFQPDGDINRESTSPVAGLVLDWLIHSSIGFHTDPNQLATSFPGQNMSQECNKHVNGGFKMLQRMLSCSAETASKLLCIIIEALPQFCAAQPPRLLTPEARDAWETAFGQQIVGRFVSTVQAEITRLNSRFAEVVQSHNRFENILNETSSEASHQPRLFRTLKHKTFESIKSYYTVRPDAEQFPLLGMIFKQQENLEALRTLRPLVAWTNIIQQMAEYRVSRQDAHFNLSIEKFIDRYPRVRQSALRSAYGEFEKAWNDLSDANFLLNEQNECHQLPNNGKFEHMKPDSSLARCCVTFKDEGLIVSMLISKLARIQCQFLEEALDKAAAGAAGALRFYLVELDGREFAVHTGKDVRMVTQGDVIEFIWRPEYLDLVTNGLELGTGRDLQVNLAKLEEQIAVNHLYSAVRLEMEPLKANPFIFQGEKFIQNQRLLELVADTIPQTSLSKEAIERIQNEDIAKNENAAAFLEQLTIVMHAVCKTREHKSQHVHEYVKAWLSKRIEADVERLFRSTDARLCHLVSLYETLEDLTSGTKLALTPERYRMAVPNDVQICLRDLTSGNEPQIRRDAFITALRRYIVRYLPVEVNGDDANLPIHVYLGELPMLWPDDAFGPDRTQEDVSDLLIDDFLVAHAYGALGYLIQLVELDKEQQAARAIPVEISTHMSTQVKPAGRRPTKPLARV
eukprot:c20270_g1_i1.p1 GENE.c20270_g1_i1~~c20270_g1_i1.p1  ORF type:complete len:1567 (+),score=272.60 c20270_g1_i1:247-4701(+)